MGHTVILQFCRYAIGLCFACISGFTVADVSCTAGAQCSQTIQLVPGWNAVYLQITPDDGNPSTTSDFSTDVVFADLLDSTGPQIDSVWTWLPHRARIEFVQNQTTEALLSQPGWLRFFHPSSGEDFLNNLFAVSANRAYLVRLDGNTPAQLVISGTPVKPRTRWVPDALNFVGFHVDPAAPPTFADYLAASSAHTDPVIYQLNSATGSWDLKNPVTTIIDPDQAYWIYSDGGSSYTGPVQLEQGKVLDFGTGLDSLVVSLRNLSGDAHSLSMNMVANGGPIETKNTDPSSQTAWLPLPLATTVAADELKRVTVGVRRNAFSPGEYAQVMSITVPGMSRWLVPVNASAPSLKGLWVGVVSIDRVSQVHNYRHDCSAGPPVDHDYDPETADIIYGITPGSGFLLCDNAEGLQICDESGKNPSSAPGAPTEACTDIAGFPILMDASEENAVASPFQFRVLLHEDASGQVRLLKDVIQMWQDGTDPVSDPGHYVLLTDDSLVPNFKGIGLRDGEVVGKRVSTIAYDFDGDTHDASGSIGGVLSATLNLAADTPSNPFLHRYHPEHNGLGVDYTTPNSESYAVTRALVLTFGASEGRSNGDGYAQLYGTYTEAFSGLHKFPMTVSGTFTLRHVSPVDTLNQ
jgi:hypothetical protein